MHSSQSNGLRRCLRRKAMTAAGTLISPSRGRKRFSKHRREQIVEEQEQMGPNADRPPAVAIERNHRFGGNLPGVRHIRQTGIHRGGGFLSARRIECEFNERDELMQRLILGKLAGRIATGEIERAVLNREPPVQRVDVRVSIGTSSTILDTQVRRCPVIGCSSVTAPVTANGRSQERLSGRSPKPLPKKMPGWSMSGLLRTTPWAPERPMPHAKTGRDHHLVQIVLVQQVLQREHGRVESPSAGRPPVPVHPSALDLERKRRGQEPRE